MGIISGLFSMFAWGIADFLGALSSRKLGYVLVLFWMQLIGLIAALVYFLFSFSSLPLLESQRFILLLAAVALSETIGYLAFYKGLAEAQVSLVSPLSASWGLATAVLSVIFYKEILKSNQILAIALITLGIIFVSLNIRELLSLKIKIWTGAKEGLITMFGWGIAEFLLVPASKALGWFLPVLIFRFFMVIILIACILFRRSSFKVPVQFPVLLFLVPIGLLDVAAFSTYSMGVSGHYASIVAPVASAFPILTIILAKIFLKEKITFSQVSGIVGIIGGLVLMSL